MVLQTTLSKATATGNGSTTDFTLACRVIDSSHVKVYVNDVLQTISTHYIIPTSLPANSITVRFNSAPASAAAIFLKRLVPLTQLYDYVENAKFSADSHEAALDLNMMSTQQVDESSARSLKFGLSSAFSDVTFPELTGNANKSLVVNASANGILWETTPAATLLDAKGDLLAASADNEIARVGPVGSDGAYLKADSGASVGVSWATLPVTSYTNTGDNRVLTSGGTTVINGESGLTFDGTTLVSPRLQIANDGLIGSAGDVDAMTISSAGIVTVKSGMQFNDDIQLIFGSSPNSDIAVKYDESTGDALAIGANLDVDFKVHWYEDQHDDAGDGWEMKLSNHVMTWGNDLASKNTYEPHFTVTPNATASNSTVAFLGNVTIASDLSLTGSNKELRFYEAANYVGFEAPSLSANQIWVLPAADGSASQVLKTDGSGNLGWVSTASGGSIAGSNTQVQYNNSGSFGASANLTFNGTTLTAAGFAGPLTGNVTGNCSGTAGVATAVTITDNESSNEENAIIFTSGGDLDGGNLGLESDGDLKYNPSSGTLTSTVFVGALTGTAATATALASGRTIGCTGDVVWTSASFDGSGNVTGTATIQANSVDLTSHTTGNYVATITGGTGITSSAGTSGEGTTHSLSVDAAQTQITSVGTITSLDADALTVDDVGIDGDTITFQDGETILRNATDQMFFKTNGSTSGGKWQFNLGASNYNALMIKQTGDGIGETIFNEDKVDRDFLVKTDDVGGTGYGLLTINGGSNNMAINGDVSGVAPFRITGSWTPTSQPGGLLLIDGTMNPSAGQYARGGLQCNPTLVEAGSGTHGYLAGAWFDMTVTNGSATTTTAATVQITGFTAGAGTTNAASLYIDGPPASATNNYAVWVDAGNVRIDSLAGSGSRTVVADANGVLSAP